MLTLTLTLESWRYPGDARIVEPRLYNPNLNFNPDKTPETTDNMILASWYLRCTKIGWVWHTPREGGRIGNIFKDFQN